MHRADPSIALPLEANWPMFGASHPAAAGHAVCAGTACEGAVDDLPATVDQHFEEYFFE
jgi:hypothetical protein